MIEFLLVFAAIGLLIAAAYSAYQRWFVKRAVSERPRVAVKVLPEEETGVSRFELTLRATRHSYECVRLTAERADVEAVGIEVPEGFVPESDSEPAGGQVSWSPEPPGLVLHPDEPVEIEVRYAPGREKTGKVNGWCEAPFGLGGSILSFNFTVGERSALAIEVANLRAELFAQAAEEGVAPNTLPQWARLEVLERELAE